MPRELGRQIGDAAGEQVRGFCEIALERVNRTVKISHTRAMEIARRSQMFAEAYRPDLVEELRGTAEAAGVSLDDMMLLQVRNQLTAEPDAGCTSLSYALPDQSTVVAQTWDNDPVLDEFTIVLTRRPTGRPATMTCTQAGLISYMGFSETGIGACVNTLPVPSRPVGVPHYFILREVLEANSLDAAVAAVARAERSIPVNIMLATPQGPADLEVTLERVHVLRPDQTAWLGHSNHCLCQELMPINDQFPELIQSFARKQRIDELLETMETHLLSVRQDSSVESSEWRLALQRVLRDHQNHPRSICRHVNDDPGHGFWCTVFALIIEPQNLCMHITRGNPCEREFEFYRLPQGLSP
ncbi:MAG: peptidase C45 [Planctomycetaceae bacterium]|nr:peptidase C45 [Planctomycetaceae bacterium]